MKRFAIIVSFISILILVIAFTGVFYVNFKLNHLEQDTYQYLLNKGYNEDEILSIEGKIKKLSLYTVEVKFKDEPDIIYDYKKDNKNKIIQIGVSDILNESNDQFKHLE